MATDEDVRRNGMENMLDVSLGRKLCSAGFLSAKRHKEHTQWRATEVEAFSAASAPQSSSPYVV